VSIVSQQEGQTASAHQIEVITLEASATTLSIVALAVTVPEAVSFSDIEGSDVMVGRAMKDVLVGIGRIDREEPI